MRFEENFTLEQIKKYAESVNFSDKREGLNIQLFFSIFLHYLLHLCSACQ